MGANRIGEMKNELGDAAPMMLQLLVSVACCFETCCRYCTINYVAIEFTDPRFFQTACIENCTTDEKLQSKVFKCLASWLNLQLLPQAEVASSNLLASVFQALVRNHVIIFLTVTFLM